MANAKQRVGKYGEFLAAEFLVEAGMRLLDRNWRCATGELDIVARDGDTLVFCEVKTRRGSRYGTPAEAVGAVKVGRLRRLAAQWLASKAVRADQIRFDVISVQPSRRGTARVEHIRGAF